MLFKNVCVCVLACLYALTGCYSPAETAPETAVMQSNPENNPEPLSEAHKIAKTEALMRQATCRIYVNSRFSGTGSLLRNDIVITCAHLFEGVAVSSIEVFFVASPEHPTPADNPEQKIPANLILLNEGIDLAILAINETNRTPVKLAKDCKKVQKIMAPSFKHGQELILPVAEIVDVTEEGLIYNASAGGGSSGGPIVNLDGELVGICKGAIEGGNKIMTANYKSIREWLGEIDALFEEILK
ncbi:MAG: trypsin-like peptidase domain-containing protein [Planctomycetes bacterium]|nr:trypsin-like peptidase domain-containing protein [Planctomycetota bacterium]